MIDREWFERAVVRPARELLVSLRTGDESDDNEHLRTLTGVGIEGIFCFELPLRYDAWPHGSTTDGSLTTACTKLDDHTLVIVGTTFLDFTNDVFPFRVTVEFDRDLAEVSSYRAEIGELDEQSGAPPRFRLDAITILRDEGHVSGPATWMIYAPRRPKAISWTAVLELSPADWP